MHDPIRPSDNPPKPSSLIERASEIYDFRKVLDQGAPKLPDVSPVAAPAPVEAPAPVAAPIPASVTTPAPRPVARAFSSPPVAAIDRERLREMAFIVPDGAVTSISEEFRIVKRRLLASVQAEANAGLGAAAQRILICSAQPNEGKTYNAINLALSIATEQDHDVVLVDADFAKPSVLSSLGITGQRGLMDALSDPNVSVEECIIPTDIRGFSVLPAGQQTNTDSEYLASARTREVLARLTDGHPGRIVIFDSPPLLAASPAATLAQYVGHALVIVRADVTSERALRDALGLISSCNQIQLLLNGIKFSPTGRSFGSYYGYGE